MPPTKTKTSSGKVCAINSIKPSNNMQKSQVLVLENVTYDDFFIDFYDKRVPVVLRGMDIGSCSEKWNKDYLMEAVGSKEVRIHVSDSPLMDFIRKNFMYKSLPFNELMKRAAETVHEDCFISKTEYYYLRSLGKNPRKDTSDLRQQFPILAEDVKFPPQIDNIFSTVFRIASAGVSLWTHYDIMDNFLIQVHGRKRAVLFPPDDALNLYLNGDKSEVIDIDNPDFLKYPDFKKVHWHEVTLEPGDILFIPALWFHNMKALEYGIAVNVFWKNLDDVLYDKKDPYGNKDLLPAQRAFALLDKALLSICDLPPVYKKFYCQRLIAKVQSLCNKD